MPHIRIENDYCRTTEFLQFMGKKEFAVLMFLTAHIVRDAKGGKASAGAIKMRTKYFDKGMLCASFSQANIATYFGWGSAEAPNKSNVSRIIRKLEKMGFLKVLKEKSPVGEKNIYQLGVWSGKYGTDNYQETLFFDEYFEKIAEAEKEKRERKAQLQQEEVMATEAKRKLKKIEPQTDTSNNRTTIRGKDFKTFEGFARALTSQVDERRPALH